MFTFILIFHVIICVLLILIVMLQSGTGAQLGAAFGGIGQAHQVSTPENFVSKLTTFLAILFAITSIALAILSPSKEQPLLDQLQNTSQTEQQE